MQDSLDTLRQYSIVSHDEVKTLRQTILQNHPHLTDAERAQLFAKQLHQKLDEALALFDTSSQKRLKGDLLKQAITKPVFSIDVLDVVQSYTQVETSDSNTINTLAIWVNQYESKPISTELLHSLTQTPTLITSSDLEHSVSIQPSAPILLKPACCLSLFKALSDKPWRYLCLFCICLLSLTALSWSHQHSKRQQTLSSWVTIPINLPVSMDLSAASNYLQTPLQYKKINETALNTWLVDKDSILATEPYFSAILDTAYAFDINPLLLFAITGQEQNFVPTTHESAQQIANNPFNLYGSWQEYNTSIEDATAIAARTIIRLGKDCPAGYNQVQWINRKYAADPNWHLGVNYFLEELEQVAG